MKQIFALLILAAALLAQVQLRGSGTPFAGRWDITATSPNATYPSWMELIDVESKPRVRIQPRTGSVRPVNEVKVEGTRLTLTLSRPAQGPATAWELNLVGDRISGVHKRGETVIAQLSGVRAPDLKRKAPAAWTDPEPLFNGKDLSGWVSDDPSNNHWIAQGGELLNETKGANLRTTRKFDDFRLHIEYNCPQGGNSGVFLRGRYEIQVAYEESKDNLHSMGAIYGFLAPSVELPARPGQWESFDVTLLGRYLTVVRNGVTIIVNREIPGITGAALDSNEDQAGPFYLQGDHSGGIRYRNITVSVPKI